MGNRSVDGTNQSPLYRALKLLFFLIGSVWIFVHFAYSVGDGARVNVEGARSILSAPNPHALRLTHSNGQTLDLKGLWKFNLKNQSDTTATELVFETPFDGFYRVERANDPTEPKVFSFEKKITLNTLGALEGMTLWIWSSQESSPSFERETRLIHKDGIVSVEYPVEVNGFMAWVERNKFILSILVIVLFLVYCF